MTEPVKGLAGSSIAAVASSRGPPFHIFYQGADGAIYGKGYTKIPWKPVRKVISDVMPLTALSVVSTNGKLFSMLCPISELLINFDLCRPEEIATLLPRKRFHRSRATARW